MGKNKTLNMEERSGKQRRGEREEKSF